MPAPDRRNRTEDHRERKKKRLAFEDGGQGGEYQGELDSSILHPPSDRQCTPANTAFITAAAYQPGHILKNLATTFLTTFRHGVYPIIFGMGEKYCHYGTKIVRGLECIESLPPEITHVCYFDARDTLFVQSAEHICRTFNSFESPFVISAEQCCFPLGPKYFPNDPAVHRWVQSWPAHPLNRRWLCAGMWMGERPAVASILRLAMEIQTYITNYFTDPNATAPEWLAEPWEHREKWKQRFSRDDQFLLQIIAKLKLRPMAWDTEYKLFANMSCSDCTLPPRNRYVDLVDGEIVVKEGGHKSAVLHFSGPNCDQSRAGWAQLLELD